MRGIIKDNITEEKIEGKGKKSTKSRTVNATIWMDSTGWEDRNKTAHVENKKVNSRELFSL